MKDLVRAVVLIKDKEPIVVEIKDDIEEYKEVISKYLTDKERAISPVNGLDFFSPEVNNIGGVVEEYSACHPYDRNRDWHGPALLTQIGDEGQTISIDDEHLKLIMERYSLARYLPTSPSDKIKEFVNKYRPIAEIYNVEHKNHMGTLNTEDVVDMMLRETDPGSVVDIEESIDMILQSAHENEVSVTSVFLDYIKFVGTESFKARAKAKQTIFDI